MGTGNERIERAHIDYYDRFLSSEGYENMPLVSLELAVQPLLTLLPSIKTYVALAKEKCATPPDGLTCDQSASIMLCTMRWQPIDQCLFYVLNTILRSIDRENLKPWFLYLKLLFTGLNRLPSMDRIVYRGIQLDISEEYSKDKTIIWWEFSLSTNSFDELYSKKYFNKKNVRTIFTIECHSSKDITKHAFNPSIDLILILPGTQFQVTQCMKQKTNLYWIQLKEIQSPSKVSNLSSSITKKSGQLIPKCPSHSSIQLRFEQISNRDMRLIVQQVIIEKQCTELWLYNAGITSQGALILSNGLFDNSKLIKLYLNDNCIRDRGVYSLCRALASNNSTLKELYLARNGITNHGAQYLAEMLNTNQTLTTLCLYGNKIADEGMKSLTHVLSYYNTSLEYLYLSGNRLMSDSSINYFHEMLKQNYTLKKLHLFNCNLSDMGKTKLREVIAPKTYFTLYI